MLLMLRILHEDKKRRWFLVLQLWLYCSHREHHDEVNILNKTSPVNAVKISVSIFLIIYILFIFNVSQWVTETRNSVKSNCLKVCKALSPRTKGLWLSDFILDKKLDYLEQKLAKLSCAGQSKYFWSCETYGVYHNLLW